MAAEGKKYMFVKWGVESRREPLEAHFKTRGIYDFFDEVTWIDAYPATHPFVIWTHKKFLRNLTRGQVSNFLKNYHIVHEIATSPKYTDRDIFMHVDDDVVFIEDWVKCMDKLPSDFLNVTSLGVNFHLKPGVSYHLTGNIGGAESITYTKKFAEFFVNNVEFGQAQDIVMGAMMLHHRIPLGVIPVCQQTSILGDTAGENPKYEKDWISYTKSYVPSCMKYTDLVKEYEWFMQKKKRAEDDFEKLYGFRIDIWNEEYIKERQI